MTRYLPPRSYQDNKPSYLVVLRVPNEIRLANYLLREAFQILVLQEKTLKQIAIFSEPDKKDVHSEVGISELS